MQYCCVECFNDKTLKDYIIEHGELGNCHFCGAQDVTCILPEKLEDLFIPVVGLYDIIENFMPLHDLKEWSGEFIWEKLNEDWDVFGFYDYEKQEELVKAIFASRNPRDGNDQFLHSFVEMEDEYWGTKDEVSEELGQQWEQFCQELKFKNRYFPGRVIDLDLLTELLPFQEETMEVNSHLYRARICDTLEKIHPSQMGKPPVERSQHGRANPIGIPYLYVASDTTTAIAEKRPFAKERVTVGDFLLKRPLKVVNLREPKVDDPFRYGDNLEFVVMHLGFIRKLGFELSKTISPKEAEIEYMPLQYLCEYIKIRGYDGVAYKSAVAKGYNLAIFSDYKLECIESELYEIKNIQYEYEKVV
ncbi:MAG: RES domain-containing protein [Dehalococcoidia bacterium]|nr:MAG: RES domain-containing protein [Dehalococcoidia bacterium]